MRRGIDRRVDHRLSSALAAGSEKSQLAKALRGKHVQALVADEVKRQLASQADRDFTLAVLLGARVSSKRTLSERNHARLMKEIKAVTGVESAETPVTHAFRSLLDAEARGLGRIAGSPYNILGKLVVPTLVDLPDGPILEIGTLHGLFAPTLVRSFRRVGQFRQLTIVDPFTGRQMQGGVNLNTDVSGTPVVEEIARWNYRELGLAEDEVRIVNGFSTDPDIQTRAGDRKYALVIIDGDHFEEGVAKDLSWVETIIAPGGIAVLDDYGDRKWPGVQAATDKYLESGGAMKMIGRVWTSAYLQMPAGASAALSRR